MAALRLNTISQISSEPAIKLHRNRQRQHDAARDWRATQQRKRRQRQRQDRQIDVPAEQIVLDRIVGQQDCRQQQKRPQAHDCAIFIRDAEPHHGEERDEGQDFNDYHENRRAELRQRGKYQDRRRRVRKNIVEIAERGLRRISAGSSDGQRTLEDNARITTQQRKGGYAKLARVIEEVDDGNPDCHDRGKPSPTVRPDTGFSR